MKYRKKPLVIDAFQWNGGGPETWPTWLKEKNPLWTSGECSGDYFLIAAIQLVTPEGVMRASLGDWIISGIKGEVYSCKPDIFEETHERVEE